jgi:colanic acid/amylovoran biosynthesis protein
MNLLITNTVPLNGGDESLLRATIRALAARWPAMRTTVLCKDWHACRARLPDLTLAPDLEFTAAMADARAGRLGHMLRRMTGRSPAAAAPPPPDAPSRDEVLALYRQADLILSAPGGFLNDYYEIGDRLRGMEIALDLGRPVVLFAQSIGPFWKKGSARRVAEVLNRVSAICVRDRRSRTWLLDCGVRADRIRLTADAAFLWRRLAPDLFRARSGAAVRQVALCFREWPPGDRAAAERVIGKAAALSRHIIETRGCEVLFVSTCQGIPGYIDDSALALRVQACLPADLRSRCTVDRFRYPPRELIQTLGSVDAFIGMRLHGAILSMLGGTPALGLGYETKTEEIFGQLGLADYQTGFDRDADEWIRLADRFLDDAASIHRRLPRALDRACDEAQENLEEVAKWLPR